MACAAATGQLTAAEFEQAVRLFVDWWQAAVGRSSSKAQQVCWTLESVESPVTGQVIMYAQLERIMPACSAEQQQGMQPLPCPAHELEAQPQQHAAVPARSADPLQHVQPPPRLAATDALQALQQQQHEAGQAHSELAPEDDEAAVSLAAAASCAPPSASAGFAAAACGAHAAAHMAAAALAQQQQQQHVHQYSIVYHETYRVPVLYVRGCELDGRLLSLEQLLQEFPALQQSRDASQADWTFITQVEHPLQRTPCFMLHPCQTAARMQLLLQEQRNASHPTAAAAAGGDDAITCQIEDAAHKQAEHAVDSDAGRWSSRLPESAAATAAAGPGRIPESVATATAAGSSRSSATQWRGSGAGGLSGDALLLLYMRAWFSMLAGLLGIDMLPFYDDDAA